LPFQTPAGAFPEGLGVIFERFRQLDRFITRDQGGTGLGLALAQGAGVSAGG
jgi:signal transduction histidine kinase